MFLFNELEGFDPVAVITLSPTAGLYGKKSSPQHSGKQPERRMESEARMPYPTSLH